MPELRQTTVKNRLLAAMNPGDFADLAPSLEAVTLNLRDELITAEGAITYAYFPETAIASLIADTSGGRIEIGIVGPEGLVGTPLVLGVDRTPHTAIVQVGGIALRLTAADLSVVLQTSAGLRRILGGYVHSLIVQVGQTVYANAELNLEGRLARWIVMTHDRLEGDEMPYTHEFLSAMLAARRPGVTTAVQVLEGLGMIRAKRGRIVVLDRERLEEMAGDTYGPAEAEYNRLFGMPARKGA